MTARLLLVDDKADNLESLKLGFDRLPYTVEIAQGGKAAIKSIKDEDAFDVVVTDLKMPDADGLEVLRAVMTHSPKSSVILLTAFGTVETAVEALKLGAQDYLTKPVNLEELRIAVKRALEHTELVETNKSLQSAIDKKFGFGGIIGNSSAISNVFDKIRQIADTRATVLLQGESGTGKELFSRAIHQNSSRAKKPFIPVHCAALTESLLESELFGHEKGSFTGAMARKAGRFELAAGGTLFLDEIGEVPLSIQVKLLRVLESKEFMRVGGVDIVKSDVRVIAATNRNLEKEVEEGNFREDLYYRLKVIQITLPPLRERRDDIPLLVDSFLGAISKEHGRTRPDVTPEAMDKLIAYSWPGNVRQLRNVLESCILFNKSGTIELANLPASVAGSEIGGNGLMVNQAMNLNDMEMQMIQQALKETDQNRTKAAKILGISRRTLQRKLKEIGLDSEVEESQVD
jgi:DNA-binding NtrC family response regulator